MLRCFDVNSLGIYDENNIFWAIETCFKPSQIEVRYTNIRFGLSIKPQIPVFDKSREPVSSPSRQVGGGQWT